MPPAVSPWLAHRRFAVVVDAGSSGSRIQVYSWRDVQFQRIERERAGQPLRALPAVEKGTPPDSEQAWQLKVEPGMSSLAELSGEEVDAYLEKLFSHARSVVPRSEFARTPVYVLATAGLRLLPDYQREALLGRTCTYLINHTPFDVGSSQAACRQNVQVITGEQEGLLGWITANYLMDGFRFPASPKDSSVTAMGEPQSKYGFLDMGGASTQIAFEPSGAALVNATPAQNEAEDELTTINLRLLDGTDASPNVFVTTFLGFGTNQARDRYAEVLLPPPSSNDALATVPAQQRVKADPCLPRGLDIPHGDGVLSGTGSFDQCLDALKPLLRKEAECARPPCLFYGVHVPTIDFSVNHFIGVSEYWYSAHDIFRLGGVYDWAGFQQAARDYCASSWETLKANYDAGKYASTVDENRVRMQCFKAAWMTTVLHEGIGLPRYIESGSSHITHATAAQDMAEDKNLLFQSVNDVHGLAVSWTLGKAVLEAAGSIPPAPGALPNTPIDVAGQVGDNAPGLGNWIPLWNWLTKNRKNRKPKPSTLPPTTVPTPPVTAYPAPVAPDQATIAPAPPLGDKPPATSALPYTHQPFLAGIFFLALAVLIFLGWKVWRMRPGSRRQLRSRVTNWLPPPLGTLDGLVSSSRSRRPSAYSALSRNHSSPAGLSLTGLSSGRATPISSVAKEVRVPLTSWGSSPPIRPDTPTLEDIEVGTSTSRPTLGGAFLRSGTATPTRSGATTPTPTSRPPSRLHNSTTPFNMTPLENDSAAWPSPRPTVLSATHAQDHRLREEYARAHYAREHLFDHSTQHRQDSEAIGLEAVDPMRR